MPHGDKLKAFPCYVLFNIICCIFLFDQVCFSANQLVDIFVLDPHLPISRDHFRQMCPAIIQQLLGNACESTESTTRGSPPSAIESKTPTAHLHNLPFALKSLPAFNCL